MKLLVLGIDAGDRRILEAMDLPFLRRKLQECDYFALREDLWSRGWPKILCGADGPDTGAFYTKPDLSSKPTHKFTQHFSTRNYIDNAERFGLTPLWDVLSEAGISSGFMGVPTTSPAPHVNGFFVSGGGGGSGSGGETGVPPGTFYPDTTGDILRETDYIFDIRVKASGYTDLNLLFTRMEDMEDRRTESFIRLSKNHSIDFGFICYMAPRNIMYLAYNHVKNFIKNGNRADTELEEIILRTMHKFDNAVERLFDSLSPECFAFVSDHGITSYDFDLNMNAILQDVGWQVRRVGGKTMGSLLRSHARGFIPKPIRQALRNSNPNLLTYLQADFDWSKSRAFGWRYIPGVFINDDRFGGPVLQTDVQSLAAELCEALDRHPILIELGLKARLYRSRQQERHYADLLPDIWIDHPDELFFQSTGPAIVRHARADSIDLRTVKSDIHAGLKRSEPICYFSKNCEITPPQAGTDLTFVYRAILETLRVGSA